MVISFFCLLIFLFIVYQLAKDDFIFVRKDVNLESIFDAIFIGFFCALFFARLFYVIFYFNQKFLNPLVFLAIPYFPGLSLIGGIIGVLLFSFFLSKNKKFPAKRFLDVLGISFLCSFSIGIFLEALVTVWSNRLLAAEEVGRSFFGIAFFIFLLIMFFKNSWREGSAAFLAIFFYALLSLFSVGFSLLIHKPIAVIPAIAIGAVFLLSCLAFLVSEHFFLRKK